MKSILHVLVLFTDSTKLCAFNGKDSTIYGLDRDHKLSRLLGFAPDLDNAKALIHSSFSYVSNNVALNSDVKTN